MVICQPYSSSGNGNAQKMGKGTHQKFNAHTHTPVKHDHDDTGNPGGSLVICLVVRCRQPSSKLKASTQIMNFAMLSIFRRLATHSAGR